MEGDRRPSSSIRLGFESLEEKCLNAVSVEYWPEAWPIEAGVPAGVAAMWAAAGPTPTPADAPMAPSKCSLSCDEHWD